MSRFAVAAVAAALSIGAVVSPANAEHGGGFHGGAGALHSFHGGERFHEALRGGGFHEGFHGERFHDHDHFRGPVIVGGLALGLGLGAVGGALLPPSVYYAPPAPSPVCYPPPPASPPPPAGYCYGPDGLLYAL
jgi:hypothetical protein